MGRSKKIRDATVQGKKGGAKIVYQKKKREDGGHRLTGARSIGGAGF